MEKEINYDGWLGVGTWADGDDNNDAADDSKNDTDDDADDGNEEYCAAR